MKKFVLLLNLFYLGAFAQKEASVWYFGHHAGLDFSTNPPTVLEDGNKMATFEGCTTICDSSGRLLFYSDGINVWDSSHNLMRDPLGNPVDDLKGNPSATQSSLVIPHPGNNKVYYLFSLPAFGRGKPYYSLIDFSSGTGVVTRKNVLLSGYTTERTSEKITATVHDNGRDIWLLTHEAFSDKFVLHKITTSGISAAPVSIQSVGTNFISSGYNLGAMKFSPDGKRLAMATYRGSKLDIYDFNNNTGDITLKETITVNFPFGVEFSPDSSLLYVTQGAGVGGGNILQYDLYATGVTIKSTSKTIYANLARFSPPSCMQLGIDNKIYVSVNASEYIGVIHDPNRKGTACNYDHTAINLNPSKATKLYSRDRTWGSPVSDAKNHAHLGFPNFIPKFFDVQINAKYPCLGKTTQFSVTTSSHANYKWDFGDGNTSTLASPSHTYASAGTYDVSVKLGGSLPDRNITKKIVIHPIPSISGLVSKVICGLNGTYPLNVASPTGGTYKINGITSTQFNPRSLGVGKHTVSYDYTGTGGCKNSKVVTYTVNEIKLNTLLSGNRLDVEIENGRVPFEIKLGNKFYNPDKRKFTLSDLQKGKYSLSVKDKLGCTTAKNIEVKNALIYNYISPNGDGINDTWKLNDIAKFYPDASITIFDRSGAIITKYKAGSNEWNGTLNGEILPQDSYFYKIVLPNGNIYKGTVSIIK